MPNLKIIIKMKVFTFLYNKFPFNVGDVMYDIIFAHDLEEAIEIRKKSAPVWSVEKACPAGQCIIQELEITPGFFSIKESNKHNIDRFAIPTISCDK